MKKAIEDGGGNGAIAVGDEYLLPVMARLPRQHSPRIGIRQILRSQFRGAGICHLSFSWVARPYDLLRANI
jgi:hypothetical protein